MPSPRRSLLLGLLLLVVPPVACTDETAPDTAGPATPDPATTSATNVGPGAARGIRPEGFSTVVARITSADGEVCEVCLWLADTSEERRRGLMGVTDLGDAAGMVFRFDEPVVNSFYMLNTPTPLSIAWFAPDGGYVAATDMEPCLEVPEEGWCPLYSPGQEYELALEVFQGDLDELGVGPGARLELVEGTEADRCPAIG